MPRTPELVIPKSRSLKLVRTPRRRGVAVSGDATMPERTDPTSPSGAGSPSAIATQKQRTYLVKAIANALTTLDEDGAVMWSAGLNRTIRLSATTREDVIMFGPDERIDVYAFTGHSGFAFGRNPMAFQDEFARSISNHEPTPTGYAGVTLAYLSLIPMSTMG